MADLWRASRRFPREVEPPEKGALGRACRMRRSPWSGMRVGGPSIVNWWPRGPRPSIGLDRSPMKTPGWPSGLSR